ncbi:EF hand domain-containing protein [Ditylenchus destructor]|uniref:EF hand domain-containing protein n=1 Tax=Ditylenchus destructor TaxID=166010 RepID=A0AAD4MWI8_9BILA|nr:EF hand domain-containing protein [Ditylenchus destructor]
MAPKLLVTLLFVYFSFSNAVDLPPQANVSDFDVIDTNADALISSAEFGKWYAAFAGLNDAKDSVRKSSTLFKSHDLDGNGQLSVQEFVPLAFAMSRNPINEEEKLFKKLDKNDDGIVTREEMQQNDEKLPEEIINGLFLVADENRDGKITFKEYGVVSSAFGGQHQTSQDAQRLGMAQSLMVSIDSEPKDNRLSQSEVLAYANKFGNNKVSETEISEVFRQLDSDRDGLLSIEELQTLPEKMIALAGIRPLQ